MQVKLHLDAATATAVFLALILTFAVVALVDSSGVNASKQPQCGDTITIDTTLHRNLVNCPNNGIIIGADHVTLDLNYHTVDGDGSLTPGCNPETEFCDEGVVNLGHDGVTVVHGSVREFAFGADAGRARHVRFLGISTSRNLFFGMVIFGSAQSVIRNGSSSRNIPPEGDGIGVFSSNHIQIVHNKIRHNPGPGIHVDDSNENLIKRNVFSRNSPGILMEADRNRLRDNRMVRNSEGIFAAGNGNVIARNRVFGALGGSGITFEGGHDNLIAHNVVVRAGRAGHGHRQSHSAGIRVGLLREQLRNGPRAVDTVVRRNRVKRTRKDALIVESTAKRTLLDRNLARDAGEDGFGVDSRKTKLTRNRAVHNDDLGIDAVRDVTDGGGNVARHNGDPRQCTHIACR